MTDITQPIRNALVEIIAADSGREMMQARYEFDKTCTPAAMIALLARLDAAEGAYVEAVRLHNLTLDELRDTAASLDAETKAFQETCVISSIRGAQHDAAEIDAARYRWLRGQELHDPAIYIGVDGIDFKNRWALGAGDETKTDAAIDAAMKGKP